MSRLLAITGYGKRLSVKNGMLVVSGKDVSDEVKINPVDVEDIVLDGGVSITTKAIKLAARAGVGLYVMDGSKPIVITPVYSIKTSETRRKQYTASQDGLDKKIMKMIVNSKIINQALTLKRTYRFTEDSDVKRAIEKLKSKAEKALIVDDKEWMIKLRHIEAESARLYWGTLALVFPGNLGFEGRDHSSCDRVNPCINYLYALLYSRAYRLLVTAGLDPYAGIFHVDKSGRQSLVYDFTEPIKPLVDSFLVRDILGGWQPMVEDCLLTTDSRKHLLRTFNRLLESRVRLSYQNVPLKLEEAMVSMAYRMAGFFRNGSVQVSFKLWWD